MSKSINNRGQTLVEFIIILPIFLIIIFCIIDIGNIFYKKSKLENTLNDIVDVVKYKGVDEANNYINKNYKNVAFTYYVEDKYMTLNVKTYINLNTFGLGFFLNNKYEIESKRVIFYEQ